MKATDWKVYVIVLFTIVSCTERDRLEEALQLAGENRPELEKVLNHYSQDPADSLKLRSARFLIENMPGHYTYTGENLSNYYKDLTELHSWVWNVDECLKQYESLEGKHGNARIGLERQEDVQTLTADFLIQHIDHAFRMWKEGDWATHLTFDEYAEYLLPYRVSNENPELWREGLENKYRHRISWFWLEDDRKNSAYWASFYLNDQIKLRGFHVRPFFPDFPVSHPASVLENMKMGTCEDYARSTMYIMRACGIPVHMDFTPQWPFRAWGHSWNTVLNNNGKDLGFMGNETQPAHPNKPDYVMAKAFRKTYAHQRDNLFFTKSMEDKVPAIFNDPFLQDVSENYFEGVDVTLKLSQPKTGKQPFAYLAVFDNQNWTPIHWGKVGMGGKTTFDKMGPGVVYLPMYYIQDKLVPAGNPVMVKADRTVQQLIPDTKNTQQMVLKRKFPYFGGVLYYSTRVVDGWFEASNHPDFRDAVEVGRITVNPLMRFDTTACTTTTPYRYWRYHSPRDGWCNIAELEFYQQEKNIASRGTILTNLPHAGNQLPEFAFDGDGLTYYEATHPTNGWIGLDFGEPVQIDHFRYLPRNDDNNITAGNQYELFVFSDNQWESMGHQTAKTDSLIYENVPSKGLYLLKNHTRGREERVFTYENEKQVWW